MNLTKNQKTFIEKVKEFEKLFNETLFVFFDDNKWCMGTRSRKFAFNIHGKTFKSLMNNNILVNKQWGSELQVSLSLNDNFR
jgi:hypothetical protein